MKRKVMWIIGIGVLLVLIVGVAWLIEIQNHHTDPNWQIANEIYKVENTLKKVDEDYECQSVSKVTPFTYTDSEGNTIVYYCCQTAYISNESGEYVGLNMDAIGMVVDPELIVNKWECMVNKYDAFLRELGGPILPVWDTISGA